MKLLSLTTAAWLFFLSCNTKEPSTSTNTSAGKEQIIKNYFSGWVKKDWSIVEGQLAAGFTFTSPNNDDHLPIPKFKDKCWPQAEHIDRFGFIRFAETERGCYVTYKLLTKENASFRNTEYFTFNGDKIESIEVFFGLGEGAEGFPTNKK